MSSDAIQQIKDRLNIVDVISPYVELHKAGRHFKGKSPFTSEKTPSFFVSPERGMYYCFSTSQGGDMFNFIQVMEGLDFKGALKLLEMKAGVELIPENPAKRTEREQLYAILEAATTFYESERVINAEANDYLARRHVSKETIEKWRIGYAPGPPQRSWRELRQHLRGKGFSDELIALAGLSKSAHSGKEPFDVFRDRVMFPLRDQNGKVVAFSGRILSTASDAPKYVNSPETPLYHKSELLYGYDVAKHSIRQLGFWLVVEGQFDVVMSHQVGYTNAVAVSGTAMTLHHVQLLERLSKKVVLALDADRAGIAAMKRAAELMLKRGMDVKVAVMPDGSDPADLAAADQKSLKRAVGGAVPVIEFFLHHTLAHVHDERMRKLKVRDDVVPFLALIDNRIDQEHFEGVVAAALGSSREAIHAEVIRLSERASAPAIRPVVPVAPTTPIRMSLKRSPALRQYLEEVCQFIPLPEQHFIKTVISDVIASVHTVSFDEKMLDPKVLFMAEEEVRRMSTVVRQQELIHLLNLWREATIKEALTTLRARLSEAVTTDADLAELTRLQKLLQAPPYTVEQLLGSDL